MENKNFTIKDITGKIYLKTGLHIGSGTEGIEIGGIDNPVIKDPITGLPYIPGSSLKGKMRSLLEIAYGKYNKEKGEPCKCGQNNCMICKVFGSTSDNPDLGITRAIFRDAFLDEKSIEIIRDNNILPTESKTENTIDRLTGKAKFPRQTERVIAGLSFNFTISLRVLKDDKEEELKNTILKGIELLESDYLGGNGSRGYGKVEFRELKYNGEDLNL